MGVATEKWAVKKGKKLKGKIKKICPTSCHLFSLANIRQKKWKLMKGNGTLVGGIGSNADHGR
jgi:hypothetical protein